VAHGKAGRADALIVRRVGRGLAVYLNAELRNYPAHRYSPGGDPARQAQGLFTGSLAQAGISREINLWTRAGEAHVPGAEVTRFRSGPVELACVVLNTSRGTSGVGEEVEIDHAAFEKASAMTVEIPCERHVYDARSGTYRGLTRRFKDRFDPASCRIYALLPYAVTGVRATADGRLRAGEAGRVRVSVDTEPSAAAGLHVVRADVYDPKGTWCSYYSANVRTEDGEGELVLPLAEGDPAGTWRLELRDVVTGQTAVAKLKVTAARRQTSADAGSRGGAQ
jgi:hypothetical protein